MKLKPLSALYFVRENRGRAVALILMLLLGWVTYIGGLYVTNPADNFARMVEDGKKYVLIGQVMTDDELGTDYHGVIDIMTANGDAEIIKLGGDGADINVWDSVMGFSCGGISLTFASVDDFKRYCEITDIHCDFEQLKPGSIIMSEVLAKNRKYNIGDTIDYNGKVNEKGDFTFDAISDEPGFVGYTIGFGENETMQMLVANKMSMEQIKEKVDLLHKDYQFYSNMDLDAEIKKQFGSFNAIYSFIVIFLSIILAITINAAFLGMYQKRNYEIAVYRAIGISKKKIFWKLVKEILLLDVISLVCGGIVTFFTIYILNNAFLYDAGKYLSYFHPMALMGLMISNIISIMPLIFMRIRQIKRADVCEY